LSFGLIQFLDAALAQSGANTAAPTFPEHDYSPTGLTNRDNILRLLVRDTTPQEDIDYYDMALQLLTSNLLRDHECGLLSAYPCDDKVWLDWLQGTELLTILPSRKVPTSYWAHPVNFNHTSSASTQTTLMPANPSTPNVMSCATCYQTTTTLTLTK